MRKRLLRWLRCPLCQGDLTLLGAASRRTLAADADRFVLDATAPMAERDDVEVDVVTGALVCPACRIYYPVHNSIPRLLTYPTRVAAVHAEQNAGWIRAQLAGFALPRGTPPRGEAGVLRNFSTEWTGYKWSGASYWSGTPDAMLQVKRYELGLAKHPLRHRLVLEVGIGIGGTADALSRSEDCEIVGMDLSYAVDQAQHYFGRNLRLHVVQASVFQPPFQPGCFDVVYSHGVLHHTHSTRAAFGQVAKLPNPARGMLYVWLYSHAQERATLLRRILMLVERLARPMLSRLPSALQTALLLPALPLYIAFQNLYRRRQARSEDGGVARYGWNEALHAARDRLTPPFAHRHSYDEVSNWFRAEHYGDLELLRDEPRPDDVSETYQLNVGIRGFRHDARGARVRRRRPSPAISSG